MFCALFHYLPKETSFEETEDQVELFSHFFHLNMRHCLEKVGGELKGILTPSVLKL